MLFSLKYLGMTLVEQPKGEELSAAAVKRIVATVSPVRVGCGSSRRGGWLLRGWGLALITPLHISPWLNVSELPCHPTPPASSLETLKGSHWVSGSRPVSSCLALWP